VNLTQIKFSKEEISLLNQGLQHSIEKPLDKYWIDLIMETEQAIQKLDAKMQDPYRILAAKKLKQIGTTGNHCNITAKRKTYNLKNLKGKLEKENAMITKADKGKIYNKDYMVKVRDFLNNNNFQTLKRNPNNKYQKLITETLKQCDLIIHKK